MRTMRVHVIQLEVEVFCLTVNVLLLNRGTDAIDFHMNYTYNLLKYASHNVLFSKLHRDSNLDDWGKPICKCISCKKNNLYCFFKKRNGEIYYYSDNMHFLYITQNQNALEKGTTLNKMKTFFPGGLLSSIYFLFRCQESKTETKAHITTVAQICTHYCW